MCHHQVSYTLQSSRIEEVPSHLPSLLPSFPLGFLSPFPSHPIIIIIIIIIIIKCTFR